AVLINKKSTGLKIGRVITGSRGELIQFLTPGDYGLVIKTRKLGQFEETITVVGDESGSERFRIKLRE
ncbi:MAG: hypothetical protein HKN22_00840, partial [Bacteroidia bacterium]|nr:hypothetical protein [Bacteroidia bacterium]